MIDINFLKTSAPANNIFANIQSRLKTIIIFGILMLGFGGLTMWHYILQHKVVQLNFALQKAHSTLTLEQRKAKNLRLTQQNLSAMSHWQSLINPIETEQASQLSLLSILGGTLPTSVFLEKIEKNNNDTFILHGKAGSLFALAEFMQHLESLACCKQQLLQEINHDAQILTFGLELKIKPPLAVAS